MPRDDPTKNCPVTFVFFPARRFALLDSSALMKFLARGKSKTRLYIKKMAAKM